MSHNSELQDMRALVKGRFYQTRFGVMECKSSDPLKAFDDERIQSMGDVLGELFDTIPEAIRYQLTAGLDRITIQHHGGTVTLTPAQGRKVLAGGELVDILGQAQIAAASS